VWTLVWWVLSLAAVATFVLVGRSLWRSVRSLGREVAASGHAAERFSARLTAQTSTYTDGHPRVRPQLEDDLESHRARIAGLRAERAERRRRRRTAHQKTYRRWLEFNR
jgi:hypothetical protein